MREGLLRSNAWTRYAPAALALGSPLLAMAILIGISGATLLLGPRIERSHVVQSVVVANAVLAPVLSAIAGWYHDGRHGRPFGRIGNVIGGVLYGFLGYITLLTLYVAAND